MNIDGLGVCLEPLQTEAPLRGESPWLITIQMHGSTAVA
jgi:hypothetical protein